MFMTTNKPPIVSGHMRAKKEQLMGGYRVEEDIASQYKEALQYYGIARSAFTQAVMHTIVRHYKAKEQLLFPLRFRVYGAGFEDDVEQVINDMSSRSPHLSS
jgi:hypothetical protein